MKVLLLSIQILAIPFSPWWQGCVPASGDQQLDQGQQQQQGVPDQCAEQDKKNDQGTLKGVRAENPA